MSFACIPDQATGICGNNYCHVDISSVAYLKKIKKVRRMVLIHADSLHSTDDFKSFPEIIQGCTQLHTGAGFYLVMVTQCTKTFY